ncbi:hypothetical protein E2C01_010151 [Portunus trituberculatus]|uniref:Uncharacterized protein n=1 Tax=Portunus trituberculatus TaxID=210409 RepID=A0A5B7D7M0_PORTR|nr:hypothetical protein [Portunus trituberculatus]
MRLKQGNISKWYIKSSVTYGLNTHLFPSFLGHTCRPDKQVTLVLYRANYHIDVVIVARPDQDGWMIWKKGSVYAWSDSKG